MLSAEDDSTPAAGPEPVAPVVVRVVHGNLAFTRYPVAVGHYAGDSIVSAEKHLDRALNQALSNRLHLGLYPGPIDTNAVFTNARRARDPYARPGGALIVGLGAVGTLSASLLTRTFSRALLEFVLAQQVAAVPSDDGAGTARELGIATLLIGTGAGGMSVADSVFALVRGASQANKELAASRQAERISDLEVIELYEDRAILALETLDRLSARADGAAGFVLDPQLRKRDGGLHRVSYDDEAPEWWQRLQVLGTGPGQNGAAGGLRFSAITRRARSEVKLLATQRATVDRFVHDALGTTERKAGLGRTLFDLLLPNEFKDNAPEQDNLVLVLDEEAARYPWELLEDSLNRSGRPFVVERGLLRQLESVEYRQTVRATAELTALVVGDPVSSFPELSGAQHEAGAVAKTLAKTFTTVTTHIRPTSQQVIAALFERPYKVMHLAGHGVYRQAIGCDTATGGSASTPRESAEKSTVTGMVLGDGIFLTPAEVAQLRTVPDLVFVNCCHLGQIESGVKGATPQERAFPRLAANLATEFIRMGVRAVVAAGWAVADDAAVTFASVFYTAMLEGEPFGQAVKRARVATIEAHPRSNTWGAYQCYGDPDFRLILGGPQRTAAGPPTFLSPAHALRDIGNLAARLKTQSGDDSELPRLDEIVETLKAKDWLKQGAIVAALGRAFGEAGQLERAVECYCASLSAEDGEVTARDVEQCANLIGRAAVQRWSRNRSDPNVTSEAVRDLRRAVHILKYVLGGRRGERLTTERLALIGSAYKRLAWIDAAHRPQALRDMADHYGKGAALLQERGMDTAYPLLNVRWAELAMQWQGIDGERVLSWNLARDMEMVRAELALRERRDGPQFWQDSLRVDWELLETIHAGPSSGRIRELADKYVSRRPYASAREFASICDSLDFLVAMSEPLPDLTLLLTELRVRVAGGAPAPTS